MGRGREIADAYIEVHGDLSKFRRDLMKGAAKAGRASGREAAESFSDAWESRAQAELTRRWNGITRAMYSGKKVDWDRVIGDFDSRNFENAQRQMSNFLRQMYEAGKMTEKQYDEAASAMRRAVSNSRDLQVQQERYNQLVEEAYQQNRMFDEATRERVKNDKKAWDDMIREAYAANRVFDQQRRERVRADKDAWRQMIREAYAANRDFDRITKQRVKDFNASLTGMVQNANLRSLERDFQRISTALATTNWGPLAKDFKSMTEFRGRVQRVTREMQKLGRVSDEEYDRVNAALRAVTRNQKAFGVELDRTSRRFRPIRFALNKMHTSWVRMDSTVRLVIGLIVAAADQMAVLGSGIAATGTAMASSLALAAANAVPLAAAFSAAGIAAVLAKSSIDEMLESTQGLQGAFDDVTAAWQGQVDAFAAAWGPGMLNLANTAAEVLGSVDFGTPLGNAFSQISDSLAEVLGGPGVAAFLEALTGPLAEAVEELGYGLVSIVNGLANLFAAAAPAAEALSTAFSGWADSWSASMHRMREDGSLAEMFDLARESLEAIFAVTGPLTGALGNIFMVGAEHGNAMLTNLGAIVSKFEEWTGSEAGRESLNQWFENGRRIMAALQPVVSGLSEALADLVTENAIRRWETFTQQFGEFLPILGDMLGIVANLGVFEILGTALNTIGQALGPLIPLFTQLASTLNTAIMAALPPLAAAIGQVVSAMAPLIATLLPPLTMLLGQAVNIIQTFAPLIAQVASTVLAALLPAFESLSSTFVALMPTIQQVTAIIGTVLMEVFNMAAPIITQVGQVLGELATVFGQLLLAIAPVVPVIAQGIAEVLTTLAPVVLTLVSAVAELAAKFISELLPALMPLVPVIFQVVDMLLAALIPAIKGIAAVITAVMPIALDLLASIFNNIIGVIEGVVTFIQGIVNVIQGIFTGQWSQVWNGMKQIVSGAVQGLWNLVQLWIIGKFVTGIRTALLSVGRLFASGLSSIVKRVASGFKSITSRVSSAMATVRKFISAAWSTIVGLVAKAVNNVRSSVARGFSRVLSAARSAMSSVRSAISSAWSSIRSLVSSAMSSIRSFVSSGFNRVRSIASSVMSSVRSRISSAFNSARSLVSSAMSRIRSAVSSGFNSVMSTVRSIPGRIIGALGSLGSRLYTVGRNMIQGMINGVGAMGGALASKARSIASGAVNAIKGFLGIGSPSKLLRRFGQWTGEGFGLGMGDEEQEVVKAAERIAQVAAEQFEQNKMYLAGRDAATGLARGLRANSGSVQGALGEINLQPSAGGTIRTRPFAPPETPPAGADGGGRPGILVEAGAIRVETPAQDPEQVASRVLDRFVERV